MEAERQQNQNQNHVPSDPVSQEVQLASPLFAVVTVTVGRPAAG